MEGYWQAVRTCPTDHEQCARDQILYQSLNDLFFSLQGLYMNYSFLTLSRRGSWWMGYYRSLTMYQRPDLSLYQVRHLGRYMSRLQQGSHITVGTDYTTNGSGQVHTQSLPHSIKNDTSARY